MQNQHPTDQALGHAREFTKWIHQNFDEGPVGQFLNRRGGPSYNPELGDVANPGRAANTMMQHPKAGEQIAGIAGKLNDPEIMKQSEDYIRNRMGEEAAKAAGPAGVNKWLGKPEVQRFIKAFPKANAEMQQVQSDLTKALESQRTIQNSAFTKFASESPQTAISRVINGQHKVAAMKEIIGKMEADPDALEALKSGIIENLMAASNNSPTSLKARMAANDMQPMLEQAFGSAGLARLNRTVDNAASLETNGEALSTTLRKRGMNLATKIIAQHIAGPFLPKGAGSLTAAGAVGRAAQDMVAGITAPQNASSLLARAFVDPKAERLLWSKIPENLKEATALTDQMRAFVSTLNGANQAFGHYKEDDQNVAQ
jgi:hypothetical protein